MESKQDLTIRRVPIDTLVEDPENTRKHNVRNKAAIRGSLTKFGQVEPLVVQKQTRRVIGGNGRLGEMKELGWVEANIIELDIDDVKAKALSIALNRSGDLATWDERALTSVLSQLQENGFELEAVGFDAADLAKRFASMRELAVDGLQEAPTMGADGPAGRVSSDHVRQVQLFMPTSMFEQFQAQMFDLLGWLPANNTTDAVLRIVADTHARMKSEKDRSPKG